MLFRGSSMNSGLIRKVTSGRYDHIAMVLKFESDPDELYLIDATGNRGVALNKWSLLREHVGIGKFYEKVVFRHIDFDRSNQMIDNLEIFLKEALGQKYSIKGIWRRGTVK